jgi:hypothetical protein
MLDLFLLRISFLTFDRRPGSLPIRRMDFARWAANAWAMARPMPRDAPVIMTFLPVRRVIAFCANSSMKRC